MYKLLLLFIFIGGFASKSLAAVEFKLEDNKYFDTIVVEGKYSVLNSKNGEFSFAYNSMNEVVYVKHKDLPLTYKIPLSRLELKKNRARLKSGNSELNLLGYKTQQTFISGSRAQCLEIHGSKDLYESLNVGASSILPLYKVFVSFTGQAKMKNVCQNLIVGKSFDETIGFPLTIFYVDKSIKFEKLNNLSDSIEKYMLDKHFDLKTKSKVNLEIKTNILYSLLDEEQKKLFEKKFSTLSPIYKIRAVKNLIDIHK